jgi:hypothetical protein
MHDFAAKVFIRENGQNREISEAEFRERFPDREPVIATWDDSTSVYSNNITHNLGKMAALANVYECMWRPDEHGLTHANQLIEPLSAGLEALLAEPAKFEALNPSNGWGNYNGLVKFVQDYLSACKRYPDAEVSVSR